ncbi:hypothetical protein COTS27_00059 [Spirochaetota bacterium]|nr:hypothetical protein COTS27_00059 [Spirochaetota bacterium]
MKTNMTSQTNFKIAFLKRIMVGLDRFNEVVAKWSAAFIIGITFMSAFIAILRYGFRTGSIALQESVVYMHAIAFLLTAAYGLRRHYHVRVDLYYSKQSDEGKAKINLIGTIALLFPVTVFWFYISLNYVAASWKYWERSIEAAGLPGVFLLKTFILIAPAMLILQGIADIVRHSLFLTGHITKEEWE